MIDKRASMLLDYINEECSDGVYKIFTVDELINSLPKKLRTDFDGIKADIEYLAEHEFINCKYGDDTQFCLVPLNKGRLFEETTTDKKKDKRAFVMFVLFSCIGGIVGGIIGGIVSGLIMTLI